MDIDELRKLRKALASMYVGLDGNSIKIEVIGKFTYAYFYLCSADIGMSYSTSLEELNKIYNVAYDVLGDRILAMFINASDKGKQDNHLEVKFKINI